MFIRTRRLFLRPAWPEDARAVRDAVGRWEVVKNLARAPWPYTAADAEAFVSGRILTPREASFLIWKRTSGDPELVGSIGFGPWLAAGSHEIGYWIAPDEWGRGYATEAGRAVLGLAFDGLRLPKLGAGHFVDNPASGAVLRKLGFVPTGVVAPYPCRARGHDVPTVGYELTRDAWAGRPAIALAA